jgi:AcrR family transcriptional regulator
MASPGVRIPPLAQERGADAPQIRRRPRQSRAQASAQALQDAFVRVLLDRGYDKTTIREVAAVAGVGVGTFYEYFGNMRALAALCIHAHVKALAEAGRAAVEAARGQPLAQVVDALLDVLVGRVAREAPVWSALFLLERQVSSVQAFRKHYEAYVQLWQLALEAAADRPSDAAGAARLLHAMAYGWVSQSLLAQGPQIDAHDLRARLGEAAQAYGAGLARG